jgi:nitronate monooxygenase
MNFVAKRVEGFCRRIGLHVPILLAPMAGACPPSLSISVMKAGGAGACGALLMSPGEIKQWAAEVRAQGSGVFQINNWIPDPPPARNVEHEARLRTFLERWGPPVPADAGEQRPPDFDAQCEAILEARPPIVSSIMGLYPPSWIGRFKENETVWFATATTVAEARAAEAAGADVIVAQGSEAGGHRGCFDAEQAERLQVGLFALLPAIVDAVRLPVVASGGIADARGIAAALMLGASAVQIGTGFLRCPEAKIPGAWADALAHATPERTVVSRVFSGRAGRSLETDYVRAATAPDAPAAAPYPVQRGLTAAMRKDAQQTNDVQRMQAWAGQSAALAKAEAAETLARHLWNEARSMVM